MPNRILREGILSSERVALLTWQEEVFYRRLMSVVDDFGCFHANPKLLRSACYPLQIDKVSDADIGKWLASCAEAALVSVYPAPDGKRYLQMLDFRQQTRAKISKYPAPPSTCIADATQTTSTRVADARLYGDGDGDGDGYEKEKRARPAHVIVIEDVDPATVADWTALRKAKRAPVTATAIAGIRREAGKAGLSMQAVLAMCCERGWTGFKAEWTQAQPINGSHAAALTVPSRDAEITAAQLAKDRLTPDQQASAERARQQAMQSIRRVAA
jgi:hypothetical protein